MWEGKSTCILIISSGKYVPLNALLSGTHHGYHAITHAIYINEVVKRVDPKHRPLWQIFEEDIAKVFGR